MTDFNLNDLGWSDVFARQLTDDDASLSPARVTEVQRDRLRVLTLTGAQMLIPTELAGAYAVGDWVLSDATHAVRRLEAKSDLVRKAAGHTAAAQRIAANVDTLGIVTSCNADFNVARLERYLTLAATAGCLPLVILTKADQTEDARSYVGQAERLSPMVTAIALNAKNPDEVARLHPWCSDGQTLALVGSSGVGKTTLRNALTGSAEATQGVREDDAKGRHTTTFRSLVPTPTGGWLIDTPGMRELQLADMQEGIAEVFDDIVELAAGCKFRNCAHESEPGCAVRAAVEAGDLAPERLARWRKLEAEDAHNSLSLAQARAKDKSFGKMVKSVMADKNRYRR